MFGRNEWNYLMYVQFSSPLFSELYINEFIEKMKLCCSELSAVATVDRFLYTKSPLNSLVVDASEFMETSFTEIHRDILYSKAIGFSNFFFSSHSAWQMHVSCVCVLYLSEKKVGALVGFLFKSNTSLHVITTSNQCAFIDALLFEVHQIHVRPTTALIYREQKKNINRGPRKKKQNTT